MERKLTRKLAAIMFTDMVGFTAMMQKDERLGLQKRDRHKKVIEQQHKKYKGEIIQYFGDGTLSIFFDSINAVRCAVEIQKALKSPIEVPLRIGIHAGNIVIESDGIIGDSVNIASRIESFSNVGGVLISDAVYDQIKNQPYWDFVPLGKFNLKNINRPFEIFAVSAEGLVVPDPNFLQGKGEKTASFQTNIPISNTPLLGRQKEVEDLIGLLKENKVVTIIGTGGIGKTRLAIEICDRLSSDFKDGIAFISMATIIDATTLIPTLAAALDIKEAEERELIKGVAAIISDKRALIVLDNLEHITSAAQEVSELASMCPNLNILSTSRSPLKIKAEQEYPLRPLSLPEQDESESVYNLMTYASVALFTNRAKKVNIDFELTTENASDVVKICRRMDGIPLALELAAARIHILPPKILLERLERALDILTSGAKDLPERHQTLRATIDWSYTLLNESEQRLFSRMAVFSDGFTLDGLESVCYDNKDTAFLMLDELESLIDNGLVEKTAEGDRYNMLQTIIDYAMEQLKDAGESIEIQLKHAHYYLEITQKINERMGHNDQLGGMKRGILEEANVYKALEYLLKRAKEDDKAARETGLCICGALWLYWHIRGTHLSAKDYVESFLSISESKQESVGEATALITTALASWALGKYEQSIEEVFESHAIITKLGDESLVAAVTFFIGFLYLPLDQDIAEKYLNEAEIKLRKLNMPCYLGLNLWIQGIIIAMKGDVEKAKKIFNEALDIQLKNGDREGAGLSYSELAKIEAMAGNHDGAINLYLDSLSSFKAIGDMPERARVNSEIAWTYLALEKPDTARKYILDSIEAHLKVGSERGVGISMIGLAAIEAVEQRPRIAVMIAAAGEYFANQEGIAYTYGDDLSSGIYLENAKKELSAKEIETAKIDGRKLSVNEVLNLVENYTMTVK